MSKFRASTDASRRRGALPASTETTASIRSVPQVLNIMEKQRLLAAYGNLTVNRRSLDKEFNKRGQALKFADSKSLFVIIAPPEQGSGVAGKSNVSRSALVGLTVESDFVVTHRRLW